MDSISSCRHRSLKKEPFRYLNQAYGQTKAAASYLDSEGERSPQFAPLSTMSCYLLSS